MSMSTCNEFLFVVQYKLAITKNTSNAKLGKFAENILKQLNCQIPILLNFSDSFSILYYQFLTENQNYWNLMAKSLPAQIPHLTLHKQTSYKD